MCIAIAANHLERHTVRVMRRILWQSAAVAAVTFSLVRYYSWQASLLLHARAELEWGPPEGIVVSELTWAAPSAILARVYYRAPCGLNDRRSCPYATDASERSDAAFHALQTQLELKRVDLPDVDLSGRDLRYVPPFVQLPPWDPRSREHPRASEGWSGANLSGSNLTACSLNDLGLRHARFTGAKLSRADLRSADLSFADLRDADLSGVQLDGTNLTGARFDGAVLAGTSLAGAILIAASGLTQAQIDGTTGDEQTLLPEGLVTPTHWRVRTHAP
jgi:hypothetical protein